MSNIVRNLLRGCGRIFPDCVILGQAIAFNMFLAFFPMLLFALGLLSTTSWIHLAMREIPARLIVILPPNSAQVVTAYFLRRGLHPQRWIYLGLGGTMIAGSQVMIGFIEGFRMIEGDLIGLDYWRRQGRACGILCLTIVPILLVVALTVFGKPAREWMIRRAGMSHQFAYELSFVLYLLGVLLLAMTVLIVLYRIGRPGHPGIAELFPGAIIASVLWWAADIIFGSYVRRVPWDLVYGELAAAIGLLLWMYITAMIVLLGAAYNAEASEARRAKKPLLARQVVVRHPASRA
ncbi:MAG TPA: YihY/virulence factor BrkB family protein [Candidatus Cybelea sp.]|nr:YihY/virulence factor BrkB family protein [Candidatus Cybelea sp.]